jgi:hypothetical protein
MNIAYVVKINKSNENNPYTLYHRKSNGKAQTIERYPDYKKTEYKYDKYHIIQYGEDSDIIYLIKNPDETPQVFLAICYDEKVMSYAFKDFEDIKNGDVPNHESIIKSQYIEPYLLFLLAETVGKTTDNDVIDNLKLKNQIPKNKKTHK